MGFDHCSGGNWEFQSVSFNTPGQVDGQVSCFFVQSVRVLIYRDTCLCRFLRCPYYLYNLTLSKMYDHFRTVWSNPQEYFG